MKSQKGVTLIEQVITLMIISLAILAWMNIFKITSKGLNNSKFNLRAQALAQTKMEEFKNTAQTLGMAGAWNKVAWTTITPNARILAFSTPQVQVMSTSAVSTFTNSRAFTSVLSFGYLYLTFSGAPVRVTYVTDLVGVTVTVTYNDIHGPRSLTSGAYISNPRN